MSILNKNSGDPKTVYFDSCADVTEELLIEDMVADIWERCERDGGVL